MLLYHSDFSVFSWPELEYTMYKDLVQHFFSIKLPSFSPTYLSAFPYLND